MTDLRVALPHLCRMEPGASPERLVERIADPTTVDQVRAAARQLVREGVLTLAGEGWATAPLPDPAAESERLLDALRAVVAEPDPDEMTRLAQEAIDATPGRGGP